LDGNKFPLYRRRDDGKKILYKGQWLDNRHVVPYNLFLATKYNCHINIEICSSLTAAKYLYKYVYKGHDRVVVEITKVKESEENSHLIKTVNYDEITNYIDGRYVSDIEACWRIFGYPIQNQYPHIIRLVVHLPDEKCVVFDDDSDLPEVLDKYSKTTLTGWFTLNQQCEFARDFKYYEKPRFFVWNKGQKRWTLSSKDIDITTGRMHTVSPVDTERFYLRYF
jgi:hypothetical protein